MTVGQGARGLLHRLYSGDCRSLSNIALRGAAVGHHVDASLGEHKQASGHCLAGDDGLGAHIDYPGPRLLVQSITSRACGLASSSSLFSKPAYWRSRSCGEFADNI